MRRKVGAPAGIYVHLPFCRARCPYCDYPVVEGGFGSDVYLETLLEEIEDRAPDFAGREVESLYFGGGTPSHAPVHWFEELIRRLRGEFDSREREVTVEANPEDLSADRLEAWADAGVNRLVLGVQSFDGATLERLGRVHGEAESRRAIELACSRGDVEVGVELLFGAPGQTVESWIGDLEALGCVASVDEVYFAEYVAPEGAGGGGSELAGAADGERERMYQVAKEAAREWGLNRASVEAFTTEKRGGRQVELYWTGGEYLGVGMGASSMRIPEPSEEQGPVLRRRNRSELEAYLSGDDAEMREIAAPPYLGERLAFGMRVRHGIRWECIRRQFEPALSESELVRAREVLGWCVDHGFAERSGGRIRPTERGLDVADGLGREIRRRLHA